jgi:hypothetical protein
VLHFKAQLLLSLRDVPDLLHLRTFNIPSRRALTVIQILFNVSPASTSILPLAIEEHCSDRRSKIIECGKVSRIKIWSPSWCINCLLDRLAEEYKDQAMYSSSWLWAFIIDNFISCNKICANMLKLVNMDAAHICGNMSEKNNHAV